MRPLPALTFLLVLSLTWPAASFAAGASSGRKGTLLTSPSRLLASVAPGAGTRMTVTVKNLTGAPTAVRITTADLVAGDDEYSRLEAAGTAARGAGTWLLPSPRTLSLLDGQQREVDVIVRVPPDATPGGHYGAIVVEQDSGEADEVVVKVRLVTHVNIVVPGDISYEAQVGDLRVPAWARDSVSVRFDVRNTGSIHTRPVARISLHGPGGTRREEIQVRELLPGGSRSVRARIDLPGPVGRFRIAADVQVEDRTRSSTRRAGVWGVRTGALQVGGGFGLFLVLAVVGWWLRRWLEVRRYVREELAQFDDDDPRY